MSNPGMGRFLSTRWSAKAWVAAGFMAGLVAVMAAAPPAAACVLTFASPQLKPHFWMQNDKARGLSKDFFDRVGAAADCRVRYFERPWRRVLRDIERGAVDFTVGFRNPRRKAFARFSSLPFGEYRFHLFGRPEAHRHISLAEYFGHSHRLIYPQGWYLGNLQKLIDAHPGTTIATTLQRGIRMLAVGRAEGLLAPLKTTLYEVHLAGLSDVVKVRSQPLATFRQYAFFSRISVDDEAFRRFDAAMTAAIRTGMMDAIEQSYLGD